LSQKKEFLFGEKPESLIRAEQNPTKYIDELEVNKTKELKIDEIWFDGMPSIPLSTDLVAIIGNKGSGKSALADIIGLVGKTKNSKAFSFLRDTKFRKPRPNRAESFSASITWKSGIKDGPIPLSENPNPSQSEKVKYIPQSYLETLCTETDEKKFSDELMKVIYSHVDESDKLGKHSLDELLAFKSEEINNGIQHQKKELSVINNNIAGLEEKKTPEYRSKIEDALKLKKEEYAAHKKNKLPKLIEPKKDDSVKKKQETINRDLTKIKAVAKVLDDKIETRKGERTNLALKLAGLQKFEQSLTNFREQYSKFKELYKEELSEYNIEFEKIVKLTVSDKIIGDNIKETKKRIQKIDDDLNVTKEGSLSFKQVENIKRIKELQSKLDEPTRKFQENQDKLKEWEEKDKEIIGTIEKQGTIKFYEGIIGFLNKNLQFEITKFKEKRNSIVKIIFAEKVKIVQVHKDLYKPVTAFISEYGDLMKDYKINLDVSIQLDNFHEKFFDYVSKGVKGSFIGENEGYNALNRITEGVNFNSEIEVLNHLDDLIHSLEQDMKMRLLKED